MKTLCIVNMVDYSIIIEAYNMFYILAWSEVSVDKIKTYNCQLIAAYLLAMQFAKLKGDVKNCGAKLFRLMTCGNHNIENVADFTVYVLKTYNLFAVSLLL